MKTIQGKYYQCEHCLRKMFGAGAMGYHEKYCKMNPKNAHKCFEFCEHLNRTTHYVQSSYYGDDESSGQCNQTEFTCAITGKKMYSYKREKMYWQYVTPDMIRMPLECELYEEKSNPYE
jgi:hypothetical protein